MINTTFKIGKIEYKIVCIEPINTEHVNIISLLNKTGKDLQYYHASKILKNGALSEKVKGVFYRFTKSGNFVSII